MQPDVGKWGGVSAALEIAKLAEACKVVFCPHWLGGGVGLAHSLHVVAAVGHARELRGGRRESESAARKVCPMTVEDGVVRLTDAPGIGFEPDLGMLATYLVDGPST